MDPLSLTALMSMWEGSYLLSCSICNSIQTKIIAGSSMFACIKEGSGIMVELICFVPESRINAKAKINI